MNARSVRADAFNARFLRPQEVGESFVRPPFLDEIAAANNTAILGPRGSGKTTLLKMLTLPALLSWTDPGRDQLTQDLDYLSIYIPSSLTWNADYRGFSGQKLTEDTSNLLSISLFRHNVLFSMLNTWLDASKPQVAEHAALSRFHLPIDLDREADMVRAIAKSWGLIPPISSIGGLREAIADRLRILQMLSVRASYVGSTVVDLLDKHSFLSAHLLDDCEAFANLLETFYRSQFKFALCFDEVEIAPDAIARAIIQMPRSIDQRFFVKFSAAPYVGVAAQLTEPTVPTQREDYRFVLLSSFSAKETRSFSESLFASLARSHDMAGSATELFGASLVDDETRTVPHASTERYRLDGPYQRRFEALEKADPSFAKYLSQRGIDVRRLTDGSENERAALIRKIIWPVLIREEFLFSPERPTRKKRRIRTTTAVADIYTGAGSLFAICEGNPRQLIGLMEPMLRSARPIDAKPQSKVRRSTQAQAVERTISAYFALVATVPISAAYQNVGSLVDIISLIGDYFRETVLGPDFNPDPVLSFEVDAGLPNPVKELVGRGINIGAFVLADVSKSGESPYRVGDITGLKARLSNIFAPHFRLPLAGGRTIHLSTILKRVGRKPQSQPLLELFGDKI